MTYSCLGSQGKLQVVIHIPLGSDSGRKGIEIPFRDMVQKQSSELSQGVWNRRPPFPEVSWRRKWNFSRERTGREGDIWGLPWDLAEGRGLIIWGWERLVSQGEGWRPHLWNFAQIHVAATRITSVWAFLVSPPYSSKVLIILDQTEMLWNELFNVL